MAKNGTDKVIKFVEALQASNGGRPIHSVYSGFNGACRKANIDPVEATTEAIKSGKLYGRPTRGGFVLSVKPLATGNGFNTKTEQAYSILQGIK